MYFWHCASLTRPALSTHTCLSRAISFSAHDTRRLSHATKPTCQSFLWHHALPQRLLLCASPRIRTGTRPSTACTVGGELNVMMATYALLRTPVILQKEHAFHVRPRCYQLHHTRQRAGGLLLFASPRIVLQIVLVFNGGWEHLRGIGSFK